MITSTIVFDHRHRLNSSGEGPLELRLTVNRKSYYIPTGIKVPSKLWLSGKIDKLDGWPEINQRLSIIKARIENEVNNCLAEGRPILSAEIKRKVWMMEQDNSTTLIDWIEKQIPALNVKESTRIHYRTLLLRLKEFEQIKNWNDLTIENIYNFDSWLHQLDGRQKDADIKAGIPATKITDGCVYNYHKCLKRLLNMAVMFGAIQQNPYDRLRGQFNRGDRETVDYLTKDELDLIINCSPLDGSTMRIVRDLFVFQAFTGFSFSDMQAFNIKDYHQEDGVWVSNRERIKTGVPFVSELLPPVVEILTRYGWQIPKIQNAKYNLLLKCMGEMLGIRKSLTSHMARHTFATLMLKSGAKIENVSAMLGHTNVKQTQRYAKVLAESVHEDFKNFMKTF